MTPVTVLPQNLQWVGAARETVSGTPEAVPTFWLPVDGGSTKFEPVINPLVDEALRGQMSMDYQQVQGMAKSTLAYKSYIYMDSAYQQFLAVLGRPDAITGTADPFLHKTSLENGVDNPAAQPQTWTFFYFDGVTAWQIPGCTPDSIKLTVKVDELATIDGSWQGLPATRMVTPPANTPTTNKPIPSWNSVISIAGAPASQYSAIELEYKRDAAEIPTINNSQSPLTILSGGFSVAGTLTAVYQGGTPDPDMGRFLVNTQPPLTVKCIPVGDATHFLLLQQSVVAYDKVEVSGQRHMQIVSTVKAIANATDALDTHTSPAQAQLASTAATTF